MILFILKVILFCGGIVLANFISWIIQDAMEKRRGGRCCNHDCNQGRDCPYRKGEQQ